MTNNDDWILVIDDDEDIREVIGLVLDTYGYRTVAAFDGQDALELLQRSGVPSLVLLDLMMPRLNGIGFAQQMASQPALHDVPFVILSGDSAARETAASLGASGYLPKPVDLNELLAAVGRFVRPGNEPQAAGSTPRF